MVVVAGEITTRATINYADVVREVVQDIGYTSSELGFDATTCSVLSAIGQQSPDISQGVTEGEGFHKEQGAGDQGMIGFACDETKEFMPFPVLHRASPCRGTNAGARKSGQLPFLRPDAKSQVTVHYKDGKPARADTVLISTRRRSGCGL